MELRELWDREARFWTADDTFYEKNLTANALMAFPEPVGVLDRDATLAAVAGAPRWENVNFSGQRLLRPRPDTAILSYVAEAERAAPGGRYRALAVSVYAREPGGWKLAFHQQTPLQP